IVIDKLQFHAAIALGVITRSRTAPAPTPAGMHVLAVPARMALVRIEPPAQHKMLPALVGVLHRPHSLLDQLGELAIGVVSALVGGIDVLGVGLDPRKRSASFSVRRPA